MAEPQAQFWNNTQFYKGHLPLKEAVASQRYVILAKRVDHNTWPTRPSPPSLLSSPATSAVTAPGELGTPAKPLALTLDLSADEDDFAQFSTTSARSGADGELDGFRKSPSKNLSRGRVSFHMYRKADVAPPPLKYTLSPKQVNHCFVVCERPGCQCECPHVHRDAWNLRVDVLRRMSMTVSDSGHNRRLTQSQIVPTAGYFFALGLLHYHVVHAVVPTMCRFNKHCRNGCMCLYIHADVEETNIVKHAADINLREWATELVLEALAQDPTQCEEFFDFLDEEGVVTVGDLQMLGLPAFEALAGKVRREWAEAFLITTTLRNLDRKLLLEDILTTFPRVSYPLSLPESLRTVGNLLDMSSAAFYRLDLMPHVMNALDMIRARYQSDEPYNIITLAKEPADSFFVKITNAINEFRTRCAHQSWRKHDATRPVVTSIMTYVDVTECRCGEGSAGRTRLEESHFASEAPRSPLPPMEPARDVGCPLFSWCRCPRRWEIGVNYELSTPSGSRCSEQNVMGKLAALGVPTWAVRDIFVHGNNVRKEANPLFPCGVCENMLQKVNKDVESQYGGSVTLYMFDATEPRKIVFLPVQEISHRDGLSFQRFVAEDLRDGRPHYLHAPVVTESK